MAARYLALAMLQALAGSPPTSGASETIDPVDLALDFMTARLDRPVSVEEVADRAGPTTMTPMPGPFVPAPRPLPAEVMVDGGRYALVRRRQDFDAMIAGECFATDWTTA